MRRRKHTENIQAMDIDIAADYPLNKMHLERKIQNDGKGTFKIPRKNDYTAGLKLKGDFVEEFEALNNSVSKKMIIDINEPLILPNSYTKKINTIDDGEVQEKIQVIDQV